MMVEDANVSMIQIMQSRGQFLRHLHISHEQRDNNNNNNNTFCYIIKFLKLQRKIIQKSSQTNPLALS